MGEKMDSELRVRVWSLGCSLRASVLSSLGWVTEKWEEAARLGELREVSYVECLVPKKKFPNKGDNCTTLLSSSLLRSNQEGHEEMTTTQPPELPYLSVHINGNRILD